MQISDEALSIHAKIPLVDAHCDTLSRAIREKNSLLPDLKLMLQGGVKLQVFALYTPEELIPHSSISFTLEMIDYFYKWKNANSEAVNTVISRKDLDSFAPGKLLCLLSIESGEALGGKLFMLDIYYSLGVRAIGLTWNTRNLLADGARVSNNPSGLTFFGEEVVKRMHTLGMVVDVSHLAQKGFWDVLNLSDKPVIASHSNCWKLHNHPRNLTDEQILAISEKGGVVGITFVPSFLGAEPVSIEQVIEHIEYIVNLTGNYDTVGLGSDFDGTDKYPFGLENVTCFPGITDILLKRGHKVEDIEKIIGRNWLRVFSQILKY